MKLEKGVYNILYVHNRDFRIATYASVRRDEGEGTPVFGFPESEHFMQNVRNYASYYQSTSNITTNTHICSG